MNMMSSIDEEIIHKAFTKVASKAIDNPKRNYAYVKGIIRSMQEDKGGSENTTSGI